MKVYQTKYNVKYHVSYNISKQHSTVKYKFNCNEKNIIYLFQIATNFSNKSQNMFEGKKSA